MSWANNFDSGGNDVQAQPVATKKAKKAKAPKKAKDEDDSVFGIFHAEEDDDGQVSWLLPRVSYGVVNPHDVQYGIVNPHEFRTVPCTHMCLV